MLNMANNPLTIL